MNGPRTVTAALLRSLSLMLIAMGLSACAMFGSDPSGPAQVDDLVSRVERVYVAAELAKARAASAFERLQTIVAPDFKGEAVPAYEQLMTALELAETHVEELRASVIHMKEGGEPIFAQWTDDLQSFSDPAMRRRSLTRLVATRERYDAICATAEPALASYTRLLKSVHDHSLFLRHDLNPASLSVIHDDVQSLAKLAADVEQQFDACLQAAQTYMEATSLPASPPPPETQPAAETSPNPEPKEVVPEEASPRLPKGPAEKIEIEEPPVRRDR